MAKKTDTKKQKKDSSKPLAPSHTKGYYRFSKEFPSVTDSEGYRDNEVFVYSPAKKASLRRRLIAVFVSVFVVTYIAVMLGFAVSRLPVEEKGEVSQGNTAVTVLEGFNGAVLSGETLSYSSVESIIGDFRMYGIDTVVIDFKDAGGYFYFKPSLAVSGDALYKASDNAADVVSQFREADMTVLARIACFADDIYARNNQDKAAYVIQTPESGSYQQIKKLWYNTGADSHAWLNPYSNEVLYYLRTIITDVTALGVDGIIFDYVVLPESFRSDKPVFEGSDESEKSVQEQITSFIMTLNSTYISCETGVFIPHGTMLSAIADKRIPGICNSGCDFIVPDSRLSTMPDNTILGNIKYTKPSVSPAEFVKQYTEGIHSLLASDEALADMYIVPMLEASDTSGVQITSVASGGGSSYIVSDDGMVYSAENFNSIQ